jgi:hypothetical protein
MVYKALAAAEKLAEEGIGCIAFFPRSRRVC